MTQDLMKNCSIATVPEISTLHTFEVLIFKKLEPLLLYLGYRSYFGVYHFTIDFQMISNYSLSYESFYLYMRL